MNPSSIHHWMRSRVTSLTKATQFVKTCADWCQYTNIDKSNRQLLQLLLPLFAVRFSYNHIRCRSKDACACACTIWNVCKFSMRRFIGMVSLLNINSVTSADAFPPLVHGVVYLFECVFRTILLNSHTYVCMLQSSFSFQETETERERESICYGFSCYSALLFRSFSRSLSFSLLLYCRFRAPFSVSVAVNVSVSHIRCMNACDCDELCVSLRDGWWFVCTLSVRILCVYDK